MKSEIHERHETQPTTVFLNKRVKYPYLRDFQQLCGHLPHYIVRIYEEDNAWILHRRVIV